jgi:hypothetical protein
MRIFDTPVQFEINRRTFHDDALWKLYLALVHIQDILDLENRILTSNSSMHIEYAYAYAYLHSSVLSCSREMIRCS